MFALLAAVAFGIASLIGFGAVTWPHFTGWFMLGWALLALHFAYAIAMPTVVTRRKAAE